MAKKKTGEKNKTKVGGCAAQIKINKGGLTACKVLTRRIINFSHLRIKLAKKGLNCVYKGYVLRGVGGARKAESTALLACPEKWEIKLK